MRHLSEGQAVSALRRGATVEQMLSEDLEDGIVRWLTAAAAGDGVVLRLHRNLDQGTDDFLDVSEFPPADESEHVGEGRLIGEYPDALTALEAALAWGARMDRWVNGGVIQDEYADLRSRR